MEWFLKRGLAAVVVLLVGNSLLTGVADAATAASCGDTITTSIVLAQDIGPCLGDGLVVTGSNITVDLGGHTVRGASSNPAAALDQAGIHLSNATRVTVRNGTVRDFFVGVLAQGGSRNTVTKMTVTHNIGLGTTAYNDGIALDGSTDNTISFSSVTQNGPDSGILLNNHADRNHVTHNVITDNNLPTPQGGPGGVDQALDNGLHTDGGSSFNMIDNNDVERNGFIGLNIGGGGGTSHQSAVFNVVRNNGNSGVNAGGNGNVVSHNIIDHNGYQQFLPPGGDPHFGGINGVDTCGQVGPPCGPDFTTIQDNQITRNAGNGVNLVFNGFQLAGGTGNFGTFPPRPYAPPRSNLVQRNTIRNNLGDGIFVQCDQIYDANFVPSCLSTTPPHQGQRILNNRTSNNGGADAGTAAWDLHDQNPDCDHDVWQGNSFGTANPPCTASHSG